MPGGQKRLTQGKLCLLPVDAGFKERFIRGAEAVWQTLAASESCSHIAQRMLELMQEHPIQVCPAPQPRSVSLRSIHPSPYLLRGLRGS